MVGTKVEGCFSLDNLLSARFIPHTEARPLFLCPPYFKKAYCIVLCCVMLCCVVLCCVVLNCIVSYCMLLYCIVYFHPIYSSVCNLHYVITMMCTHMSTIFPFNKTGCCWFILQRELQLKPGVGCVNCTNYNHNGNLLVTGGMDGMIRIFGKCHCTVVHWLKQWAISEIRGTPLKKTSTF